MPALKSRDGSTDAYRRRRSGGRRSLTAPVALASLVIALTMMLGSPGSSSADNGPNDVDVDPDSAAVTAGDLVTLTAVLTAGLDVESTGQVSFYFLPGSPNDTLAQPDFTCDGSAGSCAVSYTATNAGVDLICATSRSTSDGCAESAATDDATSTDVVERIVAAATPTPVPTPDPTPVPTPDPTPTPTPTFDDWGLTVSPASVLQGTTTDFSVRVMHTASGGNLGCAIIDVPASFTVVDSSLTATSDGALWSLSRSGNRVQVNADSGAGKLTQGEWIDFVVSATTSQAGSFGWAGWASPSPSCGGEPSFLLDQTAPVAVASSSSPSSAPTPGPVASGWQLTLGPTSVIEGSTTDFQLRLTDTSGSDDIGCVRLQVASGFAVLDTWVTGTNPAAAWSAGTFGNFVWVRNSDGAGKLTGGEWVDFTVRARADVTGAQDWSGVVVQNSTCLGSAFLDPVTLQVHVTAIPEATPPAEPTPAPVPTVPAPAAPAPEAPAQAPTPAETPAPPVKASSGTSDPALTATPSPTPMPSETLLVPIAEDRSSGEPPVTLPPVDPPTEPVAAPVAPDNTVPALGSDFLWQIWNAAADGISRAVSPEAAAQVATTFGFPLALMVAVLLFLVVQDRVDRRDPKLRTAPRNVFDTVVRFKDESEL